MEAEVGRAKSLETIEREFPICYKLCNRAEVISRMLDFFRDLYTLTTFVHSSNVFYHL